MSWTKKQLLDAAFTELGLQNYAYDLEPEDIQSAIITMDSMISEWGLALSYNLSDNPSASNADQASGLPIFAPSAVFLNLAIALCPRYGKVASRELVVRAANALSVVKTKTATIPQRQFDRTLPYGQGNKPFVGVKPQFFEPVDILQDDNGKAML